MYIYICIYLFIYCFIFNAQSVTVGESANNEDSDIDGTEGLFGDYMLPNPEKAYNRYKSYYYPNIANPDATYDKQYCSRGPEIVDYSKEAKNNIPSCNDPISSKLDSEDLTIIDLETHYPMAYARTGNIINMPPAYVQPNDSIADILSKTHLIQTDVTKTPSSLLSGVYLARNSYETGVGRHNVNYASRYLHTKHHYSSGAEKKTDGVPFINHYKNH